MRDISSAINHKKEINSRKKLKNSKLMRQSNYELLRIIAMIMIVSHHFVAHGVMHYQTDIQFQQWIHGTITNRITACIFFPGGEVGVAIFFIITGYFCINKENGSIKKIIFQTSYYGVFSLVLLIVTKKVGVVYDGMNTLTAIKSTLKTIILPGTGGGYWFVTAYVAVVLLIPIVNPFLGNLSKKGYLLFLLISWIMWYSLASFFETPFFIAQKGLFFYAIGAFLRMHLSNTDIINKKSLWIILFSISWTFGTIIAYGISMTGITSDSVSAIYNLLLTTLETCLIAPVCAVSLFSIFRMVDMGSIKAINIIASTTFGIYLIHDSFVGKRFFWNELINVDTLLYKSRWFPLISLIVIFLVFILCALIDRIRQRFIEPIAVQTIDTIIRNAKQIITTKK